MQDLIGRTLGHYRIVEKIGAGGMGEVFLANDDRLDRGVAIKVLPEAVAQDEKRLARFEREAKLLASLSHQNIATLFGLEEDEGQGFLVMELAEGTDLARRIALRPIPIDEALDYARQIAEGLEAAHEKGIIHRDLKPANIMLSSEGGIKILDFGLAKAFEPPCSSPSTPESIADSPTLTAAVTGTGVLLGTAAYMSPEQTRGKAVDKRADVWAFGCVLYEMLTGRKAFPGDDASETMAAILRDDPEWATLPLATPDRVRRLLTRCLTKDPRDRLHDIADARIELQSLSVRHLNDNGPNTHDPTSMRRSKWLSPIPVLVALVLVFGTIAVIWNIRVRGIDEPATGGPPRIVVLPFENLGPPEDEYFADGITEEITSRLAAVSGLLVISRTSAMYYKDLHVPLRQIGEELGVEYALEGTIRWDRGKESTNRVRITPQLIRVTDDSHLWSDRYDRVLEDIFTVQSDIAEQVIDQLRATLLESERRVVEARPTENMEAYTAYLRAIQSLWWRKGRQGALLAVEQLTRAVELDPGFARAFAVLSESHSKVFHWRADFTDERLALAKAAADRALELQPDLPEGHRALGYYYYWGFRDYEIARRHFVLAIEGMPRDESPLMGLYGVYKRQGKWDEAADILDKTQEINPRSPRQWRERAILYNHLRRYSKAAEIVETAIEISPDDGDMYYRGAINYLSWKGSTEDARRFLEASSGLETPKLSYLSLLLDFYDRRPERALLTLQADPADAISTQEMFLPRDLLECLCRTEMGETGSAEAACLSAVDSLQREIIERPLDDRLHVALGHAYALLGRREEAIASGEHAVEMMPTSKDAFIGPMRELELAKILTRVGKRGRAIEMLDELLSLPGEISVPLLRLDPVWDPLRDHPRFQALLEEYETGE